ncbi:hypothetical protein BOTNAR_0069g00300 [Botryotinia narcissicola]|uniref:Uncharacterized protein n=1 Tax=Botryotinia narcissicola TaxID=278944 RepID=A0A4Z1J367_9HELO|nr:hypothetical protein BOTNAR_0069g00300 [Botryotinia narcissicola]
MSSTRNMNSENTGFETNETVPTFQTSNSRMENAASMSHQYTSYGFNSSQWTKHPLTRLTSDQATSSHPSLVVFSKVLPLPRPQGFYAPIFSPVPK